MTEVHKIRCREHGGYFTRPARRGRPPVRCSADNQCDAVTVKTARAVNRTPTQSMERAKRDSTAIRQRPAPVAEEVGFRPREAVREQRRAVGRSNTRQATLDKAKAAKEQLESVDWTTAGKAYTDQATGAFVATVTATRGEELLIMTFADGKHVGSDYQLWSVQKPSRNNKPNTKLNFDPDEIPDKELVEILKGTKVTWWNRLGSKEETAVISPDKVEVTHIFNGKGDETPGERVIRFTEYTPSKDGSTGGPFRAFRLDALIKVG